MDIVQIVIIGIVGTILTLTVKQYKPELACVLALSVGILILFFGFSALQNAVDRVFALADTYSINTVYIGTVVRIIAIAYICQFASDICRDSGQAAIASKIEFCAKILILLYSLPIAEALLTLVASIMP